MPTVTVEARLSLDDLKKAIEQLSVPELEQFTRHVIAIKAQRKAPHVSHDEAVLLARINRGLPPDVQRRYNELIAKRQAETLTDAEYEELLRLTSQVEEYEAARMETLSQLATLRNISLDRLMEELGIQPPTYA